VGHGEMRLRLSSLIGDDEGTRDPHRGPARYVPGRRDPRPRSLGRHAAPLPRHQRRRERDGARSAGRRRGPGAGHRRGLGLEARR
jgi:hypothetical protein